MLAIALSTYVHSCYAALTPKVQFMQKGTMHFKYILDLIYSNVWYEIYYILSYHNYCISNLLQYDDDHNKKFEW